jgi:uridylate kinase
VFDKDPAKFDDAVLIPDMTFRQALEDQAIKVMDKAALGLALEHRLPIMVFNALADNQVAKAASGQRVGTLIND